MIALGLRQVSKALDAKADQIQHEFIQASNELDDIGRKLLEARGEENRAERDKLRAEQKEARAKQQALADQINLWRERARSVTTRPGKFALKDFLNELLELDDPLLEPAVKHALFLLDAPEEELAKLAEEDKPVTPQTPAGRLIERARMEFDLRGADSGSRQRAAVEFANRSGMALEDDAVKEIEAALDDADPMVREVALLTTIQLHRFRCMRIADLDQAHTSVNRLASLQHPAVIPCLIEIMENPRTGFVRVGEDMEEADNSKSRMVALLRLVEWHTAEAQQAIRARKFDRDDSVVSAANRALELFPGTWSGPLKGTGKLPAIET